MGGVKDARAAAIGEIAPGIPDSIEPATEVDGSHLIAGAAQSCRTRLYGQVFRYDEECPIELTGRKINHGCFEDKKRHDITEHFFFPHHYLVTVDMRSSIGLPLRARTSGTRRRGRSNPCGSSSTPASRPIGIRRCEKRHRGSCRKMKPSTRENPA